MTLWNVELFSVTDALITLNAPLSNQIAGEKKAPESLLNNSNGEYSKPILWEIVCLFGNSENSYFMSWTSYNKHFLQKYNNKEYFRFRKRFDFQLNRFTIV